MNVKRFSTIFRQRGKRSASVRGRWKGDVFPDVEQFIARTFSSVYFWRKKVNFSFFSSSRDLKQKILKKGMSEGAPSFLEAPRTHGF